MLKILSTIFPVFIYEQKFSVLFLVIWLSSVFASINLTSSLPKLIVLSSWVSSTACKDNGSYVAVDFEKKVLEWWFVFPLSQSTE